MFFEIESVKPWILRNITNRFENCQVVIQIKWLIIWKVKIGLYCAFGSERAKMIGKSVNDR